MTDHFELPSNLDNDLHDLSTAPTTPDGSLTCSPVLRNLTLDDEISVGNNDAATIMSSSPYSTLKNVCCVGAGYVGGPTAAILALNNPLIKFSVLDKDPLRIQQWNSKHLPIHETGLPEIIRICRDGTRSFTLPSNPDLKGGVMKEDIHIPARSPNLFFSTDVEKCMREADMIIIAVNTPTKNYGIGAGKATDMTAVEAVVRDIARWARDRTIVVEKSTVPCRTSEFISGLLRTHRPTHTFPILSNPEFLSAGTAIQDLLSPDRVLIGSSPTSHATHLLTSLYHFLPPAKIIHTSLASSELSKLVSNAMLAQRISSINSIACIAENIGADIADISAAVGADTRIGDKYLRAGIGFGGSCFKKDIGCLVYLAEGLGLHEVAGYWRGVVGMNEWVRRRWVERVVGCVGGGLRGKRVGVLGWAFKRGTGDVRESVAGEVLAGVLGERPDEVRVWDGGCEGEVLREEVGGLEGRERVRVMEGLYAACEGADVLLICRELEDPIPSPEEPKGEVKEPISFTGLYPTEMELLQLSKTLSSISGAGEADPLNRLNPEPACEQDCEKCEREIRKMKGGDKQERIDWKRIIKGMNAPRWMFDGRGCLDEGMMGKIARELGVEVRVVGVGRGCDFEGGR
ncbi:UDP-glucose 6-dehydrogenase protein [Rutstroemia sp. NJR-2017a WRK4]|nr:UDP-glucose 6-dehydrogenase protein [Rutstroemia sp. NJR-2017a WRK4]